MKKPSSAQQMAIMPVEYVNAIKDSLELIVNVTWVKWKAGILHQTLPVERQTLQRFAVEGEIAYVESVSVSKEILQER